MHCCGCGVRCHSHFWSPYNRCARLARLLYLKVCVCSSSLGALHRAQRSSSLYAHLRQRIRLQGLHRALQHFQVLQAPLLLAHNQTQGSSICSARLHSTSTAHLYKWPHSHCVYSHTVSDLMPKSLSAASKACKGQGGGGCCAAGCLQGDQQCGKQQLEQQEQLEQLGPALPAQAGAHAVPGMTWAGSP